MSGTEVAVRTDGRNVVRSDGSPTTAPAHYHEQQRQAPVADPGTFAARRELAHFINRNSDSQGYCDASFLAVGGGLLSSGYKIAQGVIVQSSEAYELLACAREAGLTQAHVDALFKAIGRRQRNT